jgi:hypothetical protein
MKSLCCLIVLSIFIGCSSIEVQSTTNVIELPKLSKKMIFDKSVQWITYKFVSGRAVMDYKDYDTGRIIAKGILMGSDGLGGRSNLNIIATIDCVAGKARLQIVPGDCEYIAPNGYSRYPCSNGTCTPDLMEQIQSAPSNLASSYKEFMTGGGGVPWDGK